MRSGNGLEALVELDVPFIFRARPTAVPGDLRPAWRIGLIVMLLKQCCRQQRSSLTRLHVLNWAVRSESNVQNLMSLLSGRFSPDTLIVRFDPAVNRAVDFAIGEGLIARPDGARVQLTALGHTFAEQIVEHDDLFIAEKKFTAALKTKVSEALVDTLFK